VRILRFSTLEAIALGAVAGLSMGATGCAQKDFSQDTAADLVGSAQIHLDAEQVVISGQNLDCGVKNDLWEAPIADEGGGRSIAKLLQAGRNLHFDDDVVVSEPGLKFPYVQVRGDFSVHLYGDATIRDDGPDGKLVESNAALTMSHACFPVALRLLGVRKGRFVEDASPILKFTRQGDDWSFMKLVH
jgi:hypothetical protein